jgi:hypothetical protein
MAQYPLEAYGIVTKNNIAIDTLNPKICPNCSEEVILKTPNSPTNAKWVMSYDGYQEVLEEQQATEQ